MEVKVKAELSAPWVRGEGTELTHSPSAKTRRVFGVSVTYLVFFVPGF